jgi:hypothetical protein
VLLNANIRMRCGGVEIRDKTQLEQMLRLPQKVTRPSPRHRRRQTTVGNANRPQASASGELLTYNIRRLNELVTSAGPNSCL